MFKKIDGRFNKNSLRENKIFLVYLPVILSIILILLSNVAYSEIKVFNTKKELKKEKIENLYNMENKNSFYTDKTLEKYPELKNHLQFFDRYKIVTNDKGYKGVYDSRQNTIVIPEKYREISSSLIFPIFFIAQDKDGWKILDYKNELLFAADYDEINFANGGFETKKDDKVGMVNFEGREILKPEYEKIVSTEYFQAGGGFYYITQKDDKYSVIDMNREEIISPSHTKILPLNFPISFFIYENEKGQKGVIDKYGKIIIDAKYENIEANMLKEEPYFVLWENDKSIKIVNLYGKTLLNKRNILNKYISKAICLNEKYFVIKETSSLPKDEIGANILPNQNAPKKENMYILNKLGIRCSKKYEYISDFNEEYACVANGNKFGLIKTNGRILVKLRPDIDFFLKVSPNKLVKFERRGKQGIIYNNKIITPPEYKKIYFNRGHVFLRNGDVYDIASFDDFAKYEGKKLQRCTKQQLHMIDEKCFKLTNEDGSETVYCEGQKRK